ncbi:MAG: hypothetical protein LC808_28240 [Actinobacteria bacterium]|nr:hypothetical protein [Actinomycetota bacterium]
MSRTGLERANLDAVPSSRFMLPVEGLAVPSTWPVGVVRIEPIENVADELRDATAVVPSELARDFEEVKAVATLQAEDVDEAVELTTAALGVLRVYQHTWAAMQGQLKPTGFGLPGEVNRASVTYAQRGERSGFGWRMVGGTVGFTFVHPARVDWDNSIGFQFLAGAVGAVNASEGQRRAVLAADLLSQSILSGRPAAKIISVVQALEALLLPRSREPQTFRLARYVAYFGCALSDNSLCGRDRPTCMYLANDPGKEPDRAPLKAWQKRADADSRWRCSEWESTLDLYATRSALVHGEDCRIDLSVSRRAEYRVLRWLLVPILEWLHAHPDNPAGDLEAALAALPEPPDWEARFNAAASPVPPG